MPAGDAESLSPAVTRAVRVLELLSEFGSPRVLPLSQVARRLGLPRSSTYNICESLVATGLLSKRPDGYALGRRLAELGNAYVIGVDAVQAFHALEHPELVKADVLVQLSVLGEGLRAVYLAKREGGRPLALGLAAEVGRSMPANCTAGGKALLAALPPAELHARLAENQPLQALTEHSMTDVEMLISEINSVRETDRAVDDEEALTGITCVARTVSTSALTDGVYALSVTGRKVSRMTLPDPVMLTILHDLTAQLEEQI